MISPLVVGNEIIRRYNNGLCQELSPMKLQKLLYFIHGRYLAETGRPLFMEDFKAWQYGPVLPSVYQEFSAYGANNIHSYARDSLGVAYFLKDCEENRVLKNIMETQLNKYKDYSAKELSAKTHEKDSPWYSTICNATIDNEKIRDYFLKHIEA